MYIVKEQRTDRITGVFKDKKEALDYIATAKLKHIDNFYIFEDPSVTEELFDRIYDQAIIDSLMDPEIITDRIPEDIFNFINVLKLLGGMEK